MKKKIIILGSTGSIGKTLIKILKKDKKNINILLLTANKNYKEILKQVKMFKVKNIIINDFKTFLRVKKILKGKRVNIYNDYNDLKKIFVKTKADYTMNAVMGLEGLHPTLKIIKYTKKVAIANKESIICGWKLIERELKKNKAIFVPIDSEHFSIWSLIKKTKNDNIERIFITASGGPFSKYPLEKFKMITPKLALNHPNWKMGKKISVDSATMMNKVFEVIEANKIFGIEYRKLKILIHPRSYIHAIVKFTNGLIKILVHDTNMKIPIFNSIYPNFQKKLKSNSLHLQNLNNLELKNVEKKRFPVIKILENLPNKDSLFETVIVTANDKLVNLFLNKKIMFNDISKLLLKFLKRKEFVKYKKIKPKNIEQIKNLSKYVSLKIDTLGV